MENYLNILKECPLFNGISGEEIISLLNCLGARAESFEKKCTILPEGGPALHICILLSGSAHISRTDYYGNRNIISTVYPGELFGEDFACACVDSLPVSVTANETCEIMLISCSHILHTCRNSCSFHHRLIFNLMKDIADKAIALHRRTEIISERTTEEKLMAYLMMYAKRTGSSSFLIPFNRQELADYLDVDRSGLSAEISKLRKKGVLESRKNYFRLL